MLIAASSVIAASAFAGPVSASPCKYKGGQNGLPTNGLPVLAYANGSGAPSGFIGVGDGTNNNYVQAGGDSGGGQIEAKSSAAGQSAYANTSGGIGSC